MTKALANYVDLHRHAVVRLALIANPSVAFRLTVAHMMASIGQLERQARSADDAQQCHPREHRGRQGTSRV